jgi:hypothetical protein
LPRFYIEREATRPRRIFADEYIASQTYPIMNCPAPFLRHTARWFVRIGFLFPLALAAEPLSGVITNSATGQNLEGARVIIQGSGRETVTDKQGVYRFDDVSPGRVTLSVTYTGLTSVEVPAEVSAGRGARQDVGLTSDIYQMSKMVISGEREGQAQAITLQRLSDGVKSIVSADAFGGLAGNPAELVARLPGIEGESVGGDIRYIRVRGLHQNLSSITMDGNRLADAASAGVTREFQFQTIGSDAVERIEVVKLPTPDMDGDSIGGNVNLVSKSAFDSTPERRIRGSIGTIWRITDERDRLRPNYSLAYSEVFGGRRHGTSVHAQFFLRRFSQSAQAVRCRGEARLQVERRNALLRQLVVQQACRARE